MDERQRAITYGQSVNIASDYILSSTVPGELSFGDFLKLVEDYADSVYAQIIRKQHALTKTMRTVAGEAVAAVSASTQIPSERQSGSGGEPPMPTVPPPEYDDVSVSEGEPGVTPEFQFDRESQVVWQSNRGVKCPQCGFAGQKWNKNWMVPSRNGKHQPGYRCGSQSWDQSDRKWVSSQNPPCDWVQWRADEEYPS